MEERFPAAIGEEIIQDASSSWSTYNVVTTPTPWGLVNDHLHHEATVVRNVESLERAHFDKVIQGLPSAEAIVGIGGAGAMDAAKYIARETACPLTLVPTTVSNNAAVAPMVGTQENGVRTMSWGAPRAEAILYDTQIIRAAEPAINRAGMGEILCHYPGLYDWKLASDRGIGLAWDQALADESEDLADRVASMGDEVRLVSDDAIKAMVAVWVRMGELFEHHQADIFGGGSEHTFVFNLGKVTGKRLIHAEAVSLGCLIVGFLQQHRTDRIATALAAAGGRFLPDEIGTGWEEVRLTLETLKSYADGMRDEVPYSVADEMSLTEQQFDDIRKYVETAGAAR